MPGKYFEKSGFTTVKQISVSIVEDLLDNGFELVYPTVAFDATTHTKVVMKPTVDVDPLVATQPWAIKFEWNDPATTDGMCDVYVATPGQFDSEGNHSVFRVNPEDSSTEEGVGVLGSINKAHLGVDGQLPSTVGNFPEMEYSRDPIAKTFLHRLHIDKSEVATYPISYRLGIAARGLYVSVWEENADAQGNRNSWFVVQRPVHAIDVVNPSTSAVISAKGSMVQTGKCPVHCIYGLSSLNENKPWLDNDYQRVFKGLPVQVVQYAINEVIDTVDTDPAVTQNKKISRREVWDRIFEGGVFPAVVDDTVPNSVPMGPTIKGGTNVLNYETGLTDESGKKLVKKVEGATPITQAVDLSAMGSHESGDYWEVSKAGFFKVGATGNAFYAREGDGLVWHDEDGVHKLLYPRLAWDGISSAYMSAPKPKQYCLRRFIVREKDINSPYPTQKYIKGLISSGQDGMERLDYSEFGQQFGVPADEHTVDYSAVINSKQQVAISEGNRYIIHFPNGLNTSRFSYTHEVDLIAYTSADVVSDGTEISVYVYGEEEPRVYVGGKSNGPNNTGLRMLFLKSGGGIVE